MKNTQSIKIAIIGYGKMGKEIENIINSSDDEIVAIIDNIDDWTTKKDQLATADVAIEFSAPSVVIENIKKCFALNIPVVVGTTGWYKQADEIRFIAEKENKSLFTASNFSIGAYVFFDINKRLANCMNQLKQYEVSMKETHHTKKVDTPSGTAVSLALDIIDNISSVKGWKSNDNSSKEYLNIESTREGDVVGIHEIKYHSEVDEITIRHEAFSRQGFAIGAVMAARWLVGKKGYFVMKDMMGF